MALENRSTRALILANLVPLAGVLFFQWDVFSLLMAYWVESGVIGFYNVLKMYKANGSTWVGKDNEVDIVPTAGAKPVTPEQMKKMRIFLIPFFMLHYGGFMSGHYFFISTALPALMGNGQISTTVLGAALWPMIINGITLMFSHGISYYENFIGREEYKTVSLPVQMFAPYKRVFVMHLTIILASAILMFFQYPPAVLVLLILVKILIDQKMHQISHPALQKALAKASA